MFLRIKFQNKIPNKCRNDEVSYQRLFSKGLTKIYSWHSFLRVRRIAESFDWKMPVRRGHVAPQNSYIETIIRKFDELSKKIRNQLNSQTLLIEWCDARCV